LLRAWCPTLLTAGRAHQRSNREAALKRASGGSFLSPVGITQRLSEAVDINVTFVDGGVRHGGRFRSGADGSWTCQWVVHKLDRGGSSTAVDATVKAG